MNQVLKRRPKSKTSKPAKPSPRVENNAKTTGERLGGVTGKGFMPGRSGNPGGRPRTRFLVEAIRRIAAEPNDASGRTKAEALAEKLWKIAFKGSLAAMREIMDRAEGKPEQSINVTQLQAPFADKTDEQLRHFVETGEWMGESDGSSNRPN